METIFWGPSGWLFLHTLTFLYPEKPTFTDKYRMVEFIKSTALILPCKYCRASFTRYYNSLPIDKFTESRATIIDWLYRIHNKVNGKLHRQHLSSKPNPSLDTVKALYRPIMQHISQLVESSKDSDERVRAVVRYICGELGGDFLGSIIFNYQGYFSNCHTTEEKTKIVAVYHTFFNQIIPLIAGFIGVSRKQRSFPVRTALLRTEGYTRLIKWFYNNRETFGIDAKFDCIDDWSAHFRKHIVASCNMPSADKVKSCRKINTVKSVINSRQQKRTKRL